MRQTALFKYDARGRGSRRISATDGTTCSENPRLLTVLFRGPLLVAVLLGARSVYCRHLDAAFGSLWLLQPPEASDPESV